MSEKQVTMRTPFPAHQISKLPKPTKAQTEEVKADYKAGVRCVICGGWHHPKVVHLDYVGHAALTDRLLDVDVNWNWEPFALDSNGLPAIDKDGGMWIRLTVNGVTRPGYGDAQGKTGGDAMKERIGDALRNASMRFGAALDLWHKGDLHLPDESEEKKKTITPLTGAWESMDIESQKFLQNIALDVSDIFAESGIEFAVKRLNEESLDNDEKSALWTRFDSKLRSAIKKYNEENKEKK